MKKYLSFILIAIFFVITILFVACDSTNDFGTPFTKGQEVSLTAAIGEQRPQMLPGKQRVSGINAGKEIHLKWDEEDKILIKVGDQSAEFTLSDGADTGEGTFTGIMPADGNSFRVQYPTFVPNLTEQQCVINGFGKDMMLMTTKEAGTMDGGFLLSADYALLGLQLTGDGEIGKIVLSRNNAEGKAGDESYTLLCPNVMLSAEPTLFYIVVFPGTWEKGFTVEVFASDNSVVIDKFVKTSSITFGTDNAIIMPEKNVQNLPDPCMVVKVNDTLSINMMCVEGGTFTMGAMEGDTQANANEKPAHEVTLSDYYIAQTELTQEVWEVVMGTKVLDEIAAAGSNETTLGHGKNYPMYAVSYNDCKRFIAKLNQITHLTFSLPTEAEWEYAARGGQLSKGYIYPGSNNPDEVARHSQNPDNTKVYPVATLRPNELGIYDMAGNIWEWVEDGRRTYTSEAQVNPIGPKVMTTANMRGGSSYYELTACRVSDRGREENVDYKRTRMGIRLVLHDTIVPKVEPEYVDLGLSVKWATFNVGATSPEDYGDYFAWGETKPKENYTWSNYLFGDEDNLTKYNAQDQLTTLLPEDDAVHVNWGKDWRMLTKEEYQELIDKTTSEWVENYNNTGVNGRLFTGTNGHTLFLPAVGIASNEQSFAQNMYGLYWSANCEGDAGTNFGFSHSDNIYINNNPRSTGYPIRGVKEANKQ